MSNSHDLSIWLKELFVNTGLVANFQHSSNKMNFNMLYTKKS